MFGHRAGFFDHLPEQSSDDESRWFLGGRGGGSRHGHGAGRGGPFGFGHGGFPFRRFPWEFFQTGERARRGDIRTAILALLAERPHNGYQIMQSIEERSRGLWRPSPGAVYPALQQLEDEELVRAEASGTGRVFQLTVKGQAYVKDHPNELRSPWESAHAEGRERLMELWLLIGQLASAVKQVLHSGSAEQVTEAKKILSDARRALYRLLAEEEPAD
jgi:DNA-binding PadR family transcriptional regulator